MSSPVPIPDMNSLRHQIRENRQAQGLTQEQLAELAGVNRRSVSAIERGEMDPSMKALLLILGALGITLGIYLLGKGGQNQNGSG